MAATTQERVKEFGNSSTDTGASSVQIALLTDRILALTLHVQQNKKDNATKRGLYRLVNQRKKLLSYLKRKDVEGYQSVLGKLKLRK